MRVLYFDIDGTLLDSYDQPKSALVACGFHALLVSRRFERLVCVSGWADIVQAAACRVPLEHRGESIHRMIAELFPDREWFLSHLELGTDTDHRGRLIDPSVDWYYVDDNADEFFTAAFGAEAYTAELGGRICCPHHSGVPAFRRAILGQTLKSLGSVTGLKKILWHRFRTSC
ncbi:MAG: hypothetical protein EXQ47_11755 [Bryobacterales bacterium]|nr:hypothetical protein [Bryobacterales bacterium]